MGPILFNCMFTCIASIAFNLFVIESNGTPNFQKIVALIDLVGILMLTFVHFSLSEWITNVLLEIGDDFYNSRWYRLPNKQQKLMTLPIQRAQREFRLTGLGLFECSLYVFDAVRMYKILASDKARTDICLAHMMRI